MRSRLRGGGCSDLYGAGSTRAASNEVADRSESKVRLVSTGSGDSAVYPVGLFHKGGCSHGGCLSHLGHGGGCSIRRCSIRGPLSMALSSIAHQSDRFTRRLLQ